MVPTMDQVRKLFRMMDRDEVPQRLFQLFIEDPWRILEAVGIESTATYTYDASSLGEALALCGLGLGKGVEIPWMPEQGGVYAYLRLQHIGGGETDRQIIARLGACSLLAATLHDLMRLAQWDRELHWKIPVIALGSPIIVPDFGTYYPFISGRTLDIISAGEIEHGRDRLYHPGQNKFFYLGRLATK